MRVYLVTNDWQIPFHDEQVIDNIVLPFTHWLRPDGWIWNGDIVDCYSLSSFDKNPLSEATLTKEIDTADRYMREVKKIKSITERIWIGGNHEDRVRRAIWKQKEKLPLDSDATFQSLFRIPENGFAYYPYGCVYNLGCLDVTHGSVVRMHSGWSAKAHFDKRGGSVMIGHTHRLGIYYRTNAKGTHAAYENGCLCRLDTEYVQDPDWQQGLSVVRVGEKGFFNVQQVPIINRNFMMYGNKVWRV